MKAPGSRRKGLRPVPPLHCLGLITAALLLPAIGLSSGTVSGGVQHTGSAAGAVTVPAGTVLYLRLQTQVSTKTSKKGQAVNAVIAREVTLQNGVAVPIGAALKGTI